MSIISDFCIFAALLKVLVMCTVSIKVNEEMLRSIRPDLDSTAAIRLWAQQLIDLRIQQMELEEAESMSVEDALEMTLTAVREEYAKV